MRALKIDEARIVLVKIIKFQGGFLTFFLKKYMKDAYVFRLQKKRIFFSTIIIISRAVTFSKKKIGSFGTCIGRFDKSNKFYFLISALNFFLKWTKFNSAFINDIGEKAFVFGKHLKKENLQQITRNIFSNEGVVIIAKNGCPLGFGEILKNSSELARISDKETVIINQADIGRYIRITNRI
nr:ribosome biogenesis protein [Cryptomonas sp.]